MKNYFLSIFIALSVLLIGVSCTESNVKGPRLVIVDDEIPPPPPVQAPFKTRVALVIGNANYKFAPLNNPVNDARDMA